MFKETKRKAFNFYRSYYDVFNELESKEDKLNFITSLLDKQFLNVEPKGLKGIVKFAWVSQYNSIDQQVKGYKSKTKDPMQGGYVGGAKGGSVQEEEKGQEKEKEIQQLYRKFVDEVKRHYFDSRIESLYIRLKLEKGSISNLLQDYNQHLISINRLHENTEGFFVNFINWLNVQERNKKLNKYKKQVKGAL